MLVFLVACGGSGTNTGDDTQIDAPPMIKDAPPSNIPAMITVSGTAAQQAQSGETPLAGVAISAFKVGDESTALGTATTDAQGKYTMTLTTNNMPVDCYFKATKSGFVDSYSYPAGPLVKDYPMGDANMLDTSTYGLLVSFGGGHSGNGVIAMGVFDASGMPIEGATVESNPASGAYKYSDASGFPTSTSGTAADGHAFMFDVPPGNVTVNAIKSGTQFHSHQLNARADKFTTTVIAP
jgi:hypothetical protein